jgi:hypothetical protein
MPENQKRHFIVTPVNDFHFGWTAYVLGLPRPVGGAAREGWDVAAQWPWTNTMHHVAMPKNGPFAVQIVESDDADS